MSNLPINIFFDYEGYYLNTGDKYPWNPREGSLYGISFRKSSMEEITYSGLVDRICKKIGIDESTKKLKLSYIPLVVKTYTQSYILNDDDVYVFLTSLDKEQCRSVLHVEVINALEMNLLNEQHSRVEKGSSIGVNYGELISNGRDIDSVNVGTVKTKKRRLKHKQVPCGNLESWFRNQRDSQDHNQNHSQNL